MNIDQATALVRAINQMAMENSEESMRYLRQILLEIFNNGE